MAENDNKTDEPTEGSIDYGGKAADIDKAKQKARDEDAKRLAEEHAA